MSAYYYHSSMGAVFSSMLCVIGIFLLFYQGHDEYDNWLGNLACVFALGTALVPTAEDGKPLEWWNSLHYIFAALLFIVLTLFSLWRFPRNKMRRRRNRIYYACGSIMTICLLVLFSRLFHEGSTKNAWDERHIVFWLEMIVVMAFGLSWLTKGRAMFKDKD